MSTTTSTDRTRSSESICSNILLSPPFLLCYCCFLPQVDHADGRSQHVEYISGDVSGYKANVEYREKSSYYKRTYGH